MIKMFPLVVLAFTTSSFAAAPATDVEQAYQRLAPRVLLWPSFEPLDTPLLIFDGAQTWAFRWPGIPPGFTLHTASVSVMDGRHPVATANTNATVGDVAVAVVLADQPARADELAAVALHEAFHVFQRAHYPDWVANEADAFLYPVDDPRLLTERRRETDALRRALAARSAAERDCWARRAMAARAVRFGAMPDVAVNYERHSELNEGLAQYVQLTALNQVAALPVGGFGAEEIRQRAYHSGAAIAQLLDLLRVGWRSEVNADADTPDVVLMQSSATAPLDCDWDQGTANKLQAMAVADAAAVSARRAELDARFTQHAGSRLIIEAVPDRPLWPSRFDPLNVQRLSAGRLLHDRMLVLANDNAQVEVLADARGVVARTEAAGDHPLFNGIARIEINVTGELSLEQLGDDEMRVSGAGVQARFGESIADWQGSTLRVELR